MYLTLDAIEATLRTVSQCTPGSQVVLTYNQPRCALDDFSRQVTSTFEAIAGELGEPFLSLFVPDEIEGRLRNHGFEDIVHFGPQEALAAWFGGAADVSIAGAQRLIAATVGSAASRDLGHATTQVIP
jgi:O-methyltransferase involved in polyketide biosynthesis